MLHRDEHLVIADKPHFLPVMPAGIHVRETLLTRLIERLDNPNLVPLHRIDRGTAGLVMLSPNPKTRAQYQALFQDQTSERRIRKHYEALAPALQHLTFPHVRRSRSNPAAQFFPNAGSRRNAKQRNDHRRTRTTRNHWHRAATATGRTHRLRVHLAAVGAPAFSATACIRSCRRRRLTTTHDRCNCWRARWSSSTRAAER